MDRPGSNDCIYLDFSKAFDSVTHHRIVKPTPERARPAYAVNKPACVPADQVVAAVIAPLVELGDIAALLKHLLPTTPVQTPPLHPVPTEMEIMLERLLSNAPALLPECRRHRHLRPQLRKWKPCYSVCFLERRCGHCGRTQFRLVGTGLQ